MVPPSLAPTETDRASPSVTPPLPPSPPPSDLAPLLPAAGEPLPFQLAAAVGSAPAAAAAAAAEHTAVAAAATTRTGRTDSTGSSTRRRSIEGGAPAGAGARRRSVQDAIAASLLTRGVTGAPGTNALRAAVTGSVNAAGVASVGTLAGEEEVAASDGYSAVPGSYEAGHAWHRDGSRVAGAVAPSVLHTRASPAAGAAGVEVVTHEPPSS